LPAADRNQFFGYFYLLSTDFCHCAETLGADIQAITAFDTFILVYDVYHTLVAGNGIDRAASLTYSASLTFIGQNIESYQIFTDQRGASLFPDMRFIFISEVSYCSQHRIRGCTSQGAQ
jgi:hypothetical protein